MKKPKDSVYEVMWPNQEVLDRPNHPLTLFKNKIINKLGEVKLNKVYYFDDSCELLID